MVINLCVGTVFVKKKEEIKMNEEEIKSDNQSSVEFQTSTKGVVTYKVKVYNIDANTAFDKAIELSEKAQQYTKIKNRGE
jgi:hypothetical protein